MAPSLPSLKSQTALPCRWLLRSYLKSLKAIQTSNPRGKPPSAQVLPSEAFLHPTWLLTTPLKLALREQQPLYHGPLTLVAGPHRVESGWWVHSESALRDYFLARSEHMGLLWIYRDRKSEPGAEAHAAGEWYLQGVFA